MYIVTILSLMYVVTDVVTVTNCVTGDCTISVIAGNVGD